MSGLYIDGIKMPKTDKAIHLEIHSDGTVIEWRYGDSDKIVSTAIPVPDHGRLVDVSKLDRDEIYTSEYGFQDVYWGTQVDDAPTIISADKEAGG